MKKLVILLAATLIPTASQSASFCDQIPDLMTPGDQPVLTLPKTRTPAICVMSLGLNGVAERNCYWVFAYRSAEAQAAYADVLGALTECLGPGVTVTQDQSVNHPDAYDQRLIVREGAEFAVSLKDKGALQQTLVFVRLPVGAR